MASKLSRAELDDILARETPFAEQHGYAVEEMGEGTARCRLPFSEGTVRPGGTINGPAMFGLADFTLWIAVMTAIGPQPMAVTSDMTIHFLARPARGDLIAAARLVKRGRRLCVGAIDVFSADDPDETPVAHVVGTYSVPSGQGAASA